MCNRQSKSKKRCVYFFYSDIQMIFLWENEVTKQTAKFSFHFLTEQMQDDKFERTQSCIIHVEMNSIVKIIF